MPRHANPPSPSAALHSLPPAAPPSLPPTPDTTLNVVVVMPRPRSTFALGTTARRPSLHTRRPIVEAEGANQSYSSLASAARLASGQPTAAPPSPCLSRKWLESQPQEWPLWVGGRETLVDVIIIITIIITTTTQQKQSSSSGSHHVTGALPIAHPPSYIKTTTLFFFFFLFFF